MMKILYFYLSGLLLLWSSCQRPTMLDFALRYAGENRVELEKVLDHYRNDSLKYRAVVFLIGDALTRYRLCSARRRASCCSSSARNTPVNFFLSRLIAVYLYFFKNDLPLQKE